MLHLVMMVVPPSRVKGRVQGEREDGIVWVECKSDPFHLWYADVIPLGLFDGVHAEQRLQRRERGSPCGYIPRQRCPSVYAA